MFVLPIGHTDEQVSAAEVSLDDAIRYVQRGVRVEEHFHALFLAYHRTALRFFLRWGVDRDTCQDLVQETFVRVFERIDSYRHEGPFEAWLMRIARTTLYKHHRRRSAKKRSAEEVGLEGRFDLDRRVVAAQVPTCSVPEDPFARLLRAERRERLLFAVEALPPRMRACVLLWLRDELSYAEIAAVLDVSVATVKVQMFQARQRLKANPWTR